MSYNVIKKHRNGLSASFEEALAGAQVPIFGRDAGVHNGVIYAPSSEFTAQQHKTTL